MRIEKRGIVCYFIIDIKWGRLRAMDTLRVLIADGMEDFRIALADSLKSKYQVHVSTDGREALQTLQADPPDLLIIDLMLPGYDGLGLLQQSAKRQPLPIVLATTRYLNDYILHTAQRLGVAYLMMKPCDVRAVAARAEDLLAQSASPKIRPDLNAGLASLLLSLGMPTKLRGYYCCRLAVPELVRDPDLSITKELYPEVGRMGGWTAAQVERAIRSAIQAAWTRRDDQVWRQYFSPGPDGTIPRPTNAAFLTRLAAHFLRERGE